MKESRKSGKDVALWIILLILVFSAACGPSITEPPPQEIASPAAHSIPSATLAPSPLPTETSLPPSATPTRLPSPTVTPAPQTGLPSAGDAYSPELGNTGYDIQHYELKLKINPFITYLEAEVTISAVSTLHNMTGFSLDFEGYEISQLEVDGEPTTFTREGTKLNLAIEKPLAQDQLFTIYIAYEGIPTQNTSEYIPFFHHLGIQYLGNSAFAYNQPDGAHKWFPSNDHPTDKATFRISLSVPEGMTGIANGKLVGFQMQDDQWIYSWNHPYPMATYLAMIAVGRYETIESESPSGIPIQHYIFNDLRQPFTEAAAITGEALDWMADIFGPYPYDQFGFVTTRIIRASLETQGNVILSENMLNEETVIHEIAHMWFGNWVTMASWADMWHNEGLAIYISMMWETRDRPGAINILMQNLEARVNREANSAPLSNLPRNLLFGFDSYQRGALMLHYLRQTIGDEAFFDALRLYLDRHGGGVATRADFISAFEETSGMDLSTFFTEWLDT